VEFRCRVATANGQVSSATYVAENEARLRLELEDKGLFLLSVQPVGSVGGFSLSLRNRKRKISSEEFLIFNQEMATLLRAGLPLVQSLDILRRRVPNPTFKAVLDDVYERVRSGSALSDAFEAQGGMFTGIYHASLMAGEKSGSLETVLRRYVSHMKVIAGVRGKLVSALIYPVVLLLLSAAVVGLIVFKVVPEFALFYSGFGAGAELPASTQLMVAFSTSVVDYFFVWLAVLLTIVIAVAVWIRQPGQRSRLDRAIMRLPWFGPLSRKFSTAQVTRTISTLLAGGIPLVNSLDIAAKSVGNQAVAADLGIVAREVREGSSLAHALQQRRTFPDVAIEMVEVGESTGALAEMLNSIADFYDEENDTSLTRFSNLVQPVLLIVMGIVIAGLLLSLYMPLFQLSSLAR
jgi:type IV pilus assembly protein PilC